MAPQINRQMLDFVHQRFNPSSLDEMFEAIAEVAANHQTNLLTGGLRWTDLAWNGDYPVARDRRNVAYLFNSDGQLTQRYDKVHLVPFGEYMPFQDSLPILYRLLMTLNPYGQDSQYTLTPGSMDALTVFRIQGAEDKTWRFVTPICFEDIDGPMVQKMFKPDRGSANKRADFIVNITNDGWFKGGENAQHLQASIFRAIENRAPIARSVNTGISGFVDSMGRPGELVPARTEGTAWAQLRLDSRTTLYSRYGDWFAFVCAGLTGILAIVSLLATRVGRWATGLVFRGRVIRNAS